MVILHIKHGDASQFLYETSTSTSIQQLLEEILNIYNGRLKVYRVMAEMEELAKHGTFLPPDMLGLTDEQVEELKLRDDQGERCKPSGYIENKDPIGRRNGYQPPIKMQDLIKTTIEEVKNKISKTLVERNQCLTEAVVQEALSLLRGCIMIVYPMNLPTHDPIRLEFENREDLTGTQASKEVIEPSMGALWFAGKAMHRDKFVRDFLGKNEKCKAIVKISKIGSGAPSREPVMNEEEKKQLMLHYYRKQEEMKLLESDTDEAFRNSDWADNTSLRKNLLGLNRISWKPR
ncbi:hypothetical protein M8J77_023137 [Diaphorina citri]|nr:hypothetical protein M8J77_023137 [Diaphorina citri]